MEQLIGSLFQGALGVDRVGVHENFFDLGANSLLLIQVHRELRRELQRDIPVVRLFQYPTVAALAQELSNQAPGSETKELAQAQARGTERRAARERRAIARSSA
jgi:acyl carrier protein